jgi:hypothetical protein
MLGQFKPVAYEPYGRRRSGVPRWLVLLLVGVAIGAAGVVVVQEAYLPPRLTVDASTRLRTAFERADSERQRLELALAETSKRLETTISEGKSASSDVAAARAAAQRARDDLVAVIASLPPDPRAGPIEVRGAKISAKGATLRYEVVLWRERGGGQPIPAVLQLLVTGLNARGVEATASLAPVQIAVGSFEVPRGDLALPQGFKPRQASVQLLDRANGKQLGMRVFLVN